MRQAVVETTAPRAARVAVPRDLSNPVFQAYRILHVGFVVAPLVAGIDKFFNALADWQQYLAPFAERLVGNGAAFMKVVGVIEIAAAIGVLIKPRLFGYVVAAWLLAIIVNLLMIPGFYDIALRDLGLALGALALARLAVEFEAPRGRERVR